MCCRRPTQDVAAAGDQGVEYCTALLMNLCLRSAGRTAAAAPGVAGSLLRACENLLEAEDEQVRGA